MYRLEILIKELPHTTNSLGRGHWSKKAKEAKNWHRRVHAKVLVSKVGYPISPLKKAKLTLTRFSSGKCDYDGLVSSFKHVIDGLVKCGVLENDQMKNIGIPDYRLDKAPPSGGYIKIIVEEVVCENIDPLMSIP